VIPKPVNWTDWLYSQVDLAAPYTMQGFVVQGDSSILASQAIPNGTAEDMVITKVDAGTMTAVGAGHGALLTSFGPDRIVFDFNGTLVSAPWQPGDLTRNTPGVVPFGGKFQTGNVHAVMDLLHGRVLFYDSDSKVGTLRSLADVYTGTDRVLGKCTFGNKDSTGTVRLRQGWAVWDLQAFGLIGDSDGGQEIVAYNLVDGREQWRIPARFTTNAWEEPEGLNILPAVVGNPAFLVGMTCRIPYGSTFVRRHYIYQLRDPAARLPNDAGGV
jgi:hypothetical protein